MTRPRQKTNQLRIIGGEWRGRKLSFPDIPDLRPTGDRIRETLFNWLQGDVPGAVCLDLFAGSGALGLEALSRGAEKTVFVDNHSKVIQQLKENCTILKCANAQFVKTDGKEFLQKNGEQVFDIVFLDPPFRLGLWNETVQLLEASGCLKYGAKIYVELDVTSKDIEMPVNWLLLKEKQSGQVKYQLWRKE